MQPALLHLCTCCPDARMLFYGQAPSGSFDQAEKRLGHLSVHKSASGFRV